MSTIKETIERMYVDVVSRLPVCVRHPDICGFLAAMLAMFGMAVLAAVVLGLIGWASSAEADDGLLDYGHPAPFVLFGAGLELNEKFTRPGPRGEEGNPIGYGDVSWCPARLHRSLLCGGYRHHSSAPQENDYLTIDELYTEGQLYITKWAVIQGRAGWENGDSLGSRWQWSLGTRWCGADKKHWWIPCTGLMHTRGSDEDLTVWWFGIGLNPQPITEAMSK